MAKLAIVINKEAKNATNAEHYLQGFADHNINFDLYQIDAAALETSIKQCLPSHEILLIGGGDGTIRSAAQWCAHARMVLGVLPLGTMNHFARELNLPLTVDELIAALKAHNTITIALAKVNDYVFVNNSSIGFYPKLAKKRDYYTRLYNKWLSYIPSFIETMRYHESYSIPKFLQNAIFMLSLFLLELRLKTRNSAGYYSLLIASQAKKSNRLKHRILKELGYIVIKGFDQPFSLRTSFFMVSNNLYSYQFPLTIVRENFTDQVLGLYFFKHGRLRLSTIIHSLFNHRKNFAMLKTNNCIEVDIANHHSVTISVDGDTVETTTPLCYQSLPRALTLLTRPL